MKDRGVESVPMMREREKLRVARAERKRPRFMRVKHWRRIVSCELTGRPNVLGRDLETR